MKTEKQIKDSLIDTRERLVQTRKNFDKYDNHDDMDEIERLKAQIVVLQWVLQ